MFGHRCFLAALTDELRHMAWNVLQQADVVHMAMGIKHRLVFLAVLGENALNHLPVFVGCGGFTHARQVLPHVDEDTRRGGGNLGNAAAYLFYSSMYSNIHSGQVIRVLFALQRYEKFL